MGPLLAAGTPVYPQHSAKLQTPRSFWNANGSGIAEFTNSNFASQGTLFRMEGGVARPNITYSLPVPSPTPSEIRSVLELMGSLVSPGIFLACNGDLANCFIDFYSTAINDSLTGSPAAANQRAASFSLFDQDLEGSGATVQYVSTSGVTYGTQRVFSLNRFNFDSAHTYLIPKAVGYSAGLINYFFRGRMQITLPDQGVYGVVDHAVAAGNHPLTGGFHTIKLKVRNLTPSSSGVAGEIEPMDVINGQLLAVAKFHRNTCYQADLSGEYGAPGRNWNTCRDKDEEIVVSAVAPVPSTIDSSPSPVEFTFTTPIPISASDLFLQVVYRGQLGSESDAVVVETKDISEPTYYGYYDTVEQSLWGFEGNLKTFKQFYCDDPTPPIPYEQCKYDRRSSNYVRFSPPSNFDPANAVPSFGAIAAMVDIPVSAYARVAILGDTSPFPVYYLHSRNPSQVIQVSVIPTRNQVDPSNGNLIPLPTYAGARGVYVNQYMYPVLTSGDGPTPFPVFSPLTPEPTAISFPNP